VSRLEDIWWQRPGRPPSIALLAGLSALEALFRGGAAARSALYRWGLARGVKARVPVISVGNLVVGGAGKTPVALEVVRRLRERGRRVAVLSRGYGARRRGRRIVSDGGGVLLPASEAGDEPLLFAQRLPGTLVLCGPRRATLGDWAVGELGADALVLDDGFQHRGLIRDLDIVVLDATAPFGNGRLLPRGPNREPPSALGRAHLAWLSRADLANPEGLASLRERVRDATGRPPVESRHAPVDVLDGVLGRSYGLGALAGKRTLLLCALARPEGFRATLSGLGAIVGAERVYRDHHPFRESEVREVLRAAVDAGCEVIATTEKDAVRLPPEVAGDPRLRVVRIAIDILKGSQVLDGLLDRVLEPGEVLVESSAR
jgi:tetraacyldisaccharide 4'-kinase